MSERHYADIYHCPSCDQPVYDDIQAKRWNTGGYGMHEHQRDESDRIVARSLIVKQLDRMAQSRKFSGAGPETGKPNA